MDPPDEKLYWKNISAELEVSVHSEEREERELNLLKKIIHRYNEEIVGHFSPGTFRFSRIFLLSFFKSIFNKYFDKVQWRWVNKAQLKQKIKELQKRVDELDTKSSLQYQCETRQDNLPRLQRVTTVTVVETGSITVEINGKAYSINVLPL